MDKQRLQELAGVITEARDFDAPSHTLGPALWAILSNAEEEYGRDNEVVQYFSRALHALADS